MRREFVEGPKGVGEDGVKNREEDSHDFRHTPSFITIGCYLQNSPLRGCFCFLIHSSLYAGGGAMAYYKVRIEVWCDWNPAESDLDEIAQSMGVGEAICTRREVVAVVNRPQDIEDEEA